MEPHRSSSLSSPSLSSMESLNTTTTTPTTTSLNPTPVPSLLSSDQSLTSDSLIKVKAKEKKEENEEGETQGEKVKVSIPKNKDEVEVSLVVLQQENQSLKSELNEKLNLIQELQRQLQSNELNSNQLNERIRKTVNVLVRFGTSSDPIPEQIPELFREAILSIRSHTHTCIQETEDFKLRHETLELKLQSILPQLNQLPILQNQLTTLTTTLDEVRHQVILKDQQLSSTESQLTTLQSNLVKSQKEVQQYQRQLQSLQSQLERKDHELSTTLQSNQQLKDQLHHLQLALQVEDETKKMDMTYKLNALERKLEKYQLENEGLKQERIAYLNEKKEWGSTMDELQCKIKDLNAEIHSLNHHIQHRLNDIAQQHEVDRQWISNHIIQFILHPEKQKDILTLLSTTLSFTQDQKRAIGLVPSSSSSVATPDTTPMIASSSLSDQWISFLLKEVHPPPPPNPTSSSSSSSSSSFSFMSLDQEKDNETERTMGEKNKV